MRLRVFDHSHREGHFELTAPPRSAVGRGLTIASGEAGSKGCGVLGDGAVSFRG